jgi:hypothetical protein
MCHVTFDPVAEKVPPPPPGKAPVTHTWDVTAQCGSAQLTVFDKPITVAFRYTKEAPQFIGFWDGQEWVYLETKVDANIRTATASTAHLTELAAFGDAPAAATAPRVLGGGTGPAVPIFVAIVAVVAIGGATYLVRTRLAPAAAEPAGAAPSAAPWSQLPPSRSTAIPVIEDLARPAPVVAPKKVVTKPVPVTTSTAEADKPKAARPRKAAAAQKVPPISDEPPPAAPRRKPARPKSGK